MLIFIYFSKSEKNRSYNILLKSEQEGNIFEESNYFQKK